MMSSVLLVNNTKRNCKVSNSTVAEKKRKPRFKAVRKVWFCIIVLFDGLWGRYVLPWGEGCCVFGKDIRLVLKVPHYFSMVFTEVMPWWIFRTSLKSV